MKRFQDIILFHNNLKIAMIKTLCVPKQEIKLTTSTQSMTPGVFFNKNIKKYLHKDCLLVNRFFFTRQFEILWKMFKFPITRKEIRQIQMLLEYSMMIYMYLYNDNSFFTREFDGLSHQQLHCLHIALHEYEKPVLSFHNEKPSPVFEALQHCIQYEHDLFLTIIRYIVSRSITKVCYCQRDIYYLNLLKNMSNYKQHDIGVIPVSSSTALKIRREYEHLQYKKDTIYKYTSLWQNMNDNNYAYCHSYFAELNYDENKHEETLCIKTNNQLLGNLHLIYDSKKMDIYKEYLAILAIITTEQKNTADMIIYYDSRYNMNFLSNEYHNSFDPIPTNVPVSIHYVIMGFNKLSFLCSQKIYLQDQDEKNKATSKSNIKAQVASIGENSAENPNIVTSDDYEDANIGFESFVLEYLHWAAVYGKK